MAQGLLFFVKNNKVYPYVLTRHYLSCLINNPLQKKYYFYHKHQQMKKPFLALLIFMFPVLLLHAQYYYKDIVSNKQLIAEMALLKENKIKTVSLKSFEGDGSPSEGFFCEKKISKNYTATETATQSNATATSSFKSFFNERGLLVQTTDSSDIAAGTSVYVYDSRDRIISIVSTIRSSDEDFKNDLKEEHVYEYAATGIPAKMIRVKNGSDTTVFLFSADDKNNIIIEKNTKNSDTYYYYYDSKQRLTDIVIFNRFKQQLLPDYIFEYNSQGQIGQMTATEEGGSYYYIWRYTYQDGLRTKEKCYSKEKKLIGAVEYEYR
jgi:hypothetical protein